MRLMLGARAAAGIAMLLLAGGCTYNRIVRSAQVGTETAAYCPLVWAGAGPAGWTVAALRQFVDSLPAPGCPRIELMIHRAGAAIDWQRGAQEQVDDWIVRSIITQDSDGTESHSRIHAFAEPPAPKVSELPDAEREGPVLVILETGPRGPRGYRGPRGPRGLVGLQGDKGDDGEGGPSGPAAPAPDPPDEDSGESGGSRRSAGNGAGPQSGPTAWIARNAAPAVVGGGIVYGLVYLNVIGVPAAAAAVVPGGYSDVLRRRSRRRDEEDSAEADAGAFVAPSLIDDRRVRIRSAGFDGGPA